MFGIRLLGACTAVALTLVPSAAAQVGSPIGAPVVFTPAPGTTLHVEGMGPFRGSLEIRREGGGVTVVNELGLDEYVMGIREVPGMWPMEALKAQAVAARTYALWEKRRDHWQQFGFDICDSTACQVYTGAEAEQGERGRRWVQAVTETAGQVLLHDGEPILARYHSTSGGQTLPNEVVYPSSGPRPYLVGVDDPPDAVSPMHRWEVSFSRDELEQILRSAIGLAGTLDQVLADQSARSVVIRTLGGELEISSVRFRREVSGTAPRLYPDRFPGPRSDGRRLPETIPSSRFDVERTEDGFLLRGRGWGHGVGMSQWGAMGRAERGDAYDQILGAYYGELRPQTWRDGERIRVAITRRTSAVRVSGDGTFGVSTQGQDLAGSTLGGWSVGATGDRSLQLTPPEGHDLPLVLTGVRVPDELLVDPPEGAGSLDIDFVAPKPAEVEAVLSREGEEVASGRMVVEAGEHRLRLPLDPGRLPRRATYDLAIEAFDGLDRVHDAAQVVIERPAPNLIAWALAATVLALAGGLLYRWRRGRP